jgi:epoxyqueuosine reductase
MGELKALITELAGALGFARVGIAPARPSTQADRFHEFLALGYQADMAYLARNGEARCDVRSVLAGAASVICVAASYAPDPCGEGTEHIARYARGRDYHRVLRSRCRSLVAELSRAEPNLAARICVDTAPVLERDLAAAAGLGWIGRNGCLINREFGSYLLLAEIVTNLPLAPDEPVPKRCGTCRACVDACPAGAIRESGLVDSRRCVSYLTIEHRGRIPEELRGAMGRWVFGCDLCQEACPFNRRAPAGDAELRGPSELARTPLGAMLDWTHEDWDRATRATAARRAKYEMFLRNAAIAAGNARDPALRAPLARLLRRGSPVLVEAARWALGRLEDSQRRGPAPRGQV